MKHVFLILGFLLAGLASPAWFVMSWAGRWIGDGPQTLQEYVVAILLTPLAMIGVPFVPVLRFAAFLIDQGDVDS